MFLRCYQLWLIAFVVLLCCLGDRQNEDLFFRRFLSFLKNIQCQNFLFLLRYHSIEFFLIWTVTLKTRTSRLKLDREPKISIFSVEISCLFLYPLSFFKQSVYSTWFWCVGIQTNWLVFLDMIYKTVSIFYGFLYHMLCYSWNCFSRNIVTNTSSLLRIRVELFQSWFSNHQEKEVALPLLILIYKFHGNPIITSNYYNNAKTLVRNTWKCVFHKKVKNKRAVLC